MIRGRGAGGSLVGWMALVALILPAVAGAQGVRGELSAFGNYIEYREVVRVSLPESEVPGEGPVRRLEDGTVVTCEGDDCWYYTAGEVESASPLTQELRLTAWPGMQGIHARARVRGRMGSDDFWPKSDERVEVLALNLDFERPTYRLRAGRQEHGGGLGFHYFDGLAVLWRGWKPVRVEGYVGRSLARTVVQTYSGDLLEEADDLPPDEPATLWGVEAKLRLGTAVSGGVIYQRELRDDRDGLYSERLGVDALLEANGVALELSGDYDLVLTEVNDARARVSASPVSRTRLSLEGRYYKPFFDLWTIWGVFSPVGYGEGKGTVLVDVGNGLSTYWGAAYREYEDTDAGADAAPIEGDGWRLFGGGTWSRWPWTVAATYSLHDGYGAYRSAVDASVGRSFGARAHLAVFGQGTRQFTEFRFGEGQTTGAGLEGRFREGPVRLDGRFGFFHHAFDGRPGYDDYDQLRGRLGVTIEFGTEPGVSRGGKGGRS